MHLTLFCQKKSSVCNLNSLWYQQLFFAGYWRGTTQGNNFLIHGCYHSNYGINKIKTHFMEGVSIMVLISILLHFQVTID